MKNSRFSFSLLAIALLALLFSSLASAQASRTWVSGVGDDANPCSRTAPCKTFAGAISKTAPGGEIDCLDPGGFGALTITKSITINCDVGVGSVLVTGTNAIVINAGVNDIVTIRSLSVDGIVNGPNSGLVGIKVLSAKTVHLEDVNMFGFQTAGVQVAASAATNVTLNQVIIMDCAVGLDVSSSAGNAIADVINSQIWSNPTGVKGEGNSLITIKDSTVSLSSGVAVQQTAGGSQINLVNSQLSSNATAVQSIAGSTLRISGNTFTQNGVAVNINGGSVLSDGQNTQEGNGIVGAPGALPAPAKI